MAKKEGKIEVPTTDDAGHVTTEKVKVKSVMDYTEDELEEMRVLKPKKYHEVMKLRRKKIRAEKAKKKEQVPKMTMNELRKLEKDDPAEYKKVMKLMQKARKSELKARLGSINPYPEETLQAARIELKAMDKGIWYPNFRLPRRKTAVERFLES